MIYKDVSDSTIPFSIESLRYAFSRAYAENLGCIITINCNGFLNVKVMQENILYMSESTIQPYDLEADD